METCKTCKWWEVATSLGGQPQKYGNCENVMSSKPVSDRIYEDEYTHVMTGPDFGCIHHEPKGGAE